MSDKIVTLARDNQDPQGHAAKIIEHARMIAGHETEGCELDGFMVIGMYRDGSHSVGWRWNPTTNTIPRRLMPAYIAEIIREELITDGCAQDAAVKVFNQGPV